MTDPALPYAGTSGHVNVDTSRDATHERDANGKTTDIQQWILDTAHARREVGVTVVELRRRTTEHHGRISGALTALHKVGRLAALRERRGGAGVYVLPEHVEGREVRLYKPNRPQIDAADLAIEIGRHSLMLSLRSSSRWCKCGQTIPDGMSYNRHVAEAIAAEFGR